MPSYQQIFKPSYQQLRRGSSYNLNQSECQELLHAKVKRDRPSGPLTRGVSFRGPLGAADPGVRWAPSPFAIRKLQREIIRAWQEEFLFEIKGLELQFDPTFDPKEFSGLAVRHPGNGKFMEFTDDTSVRNKTVCREGRKEI